MKEYNPVNIENTKNANNAEQTRQMEAEGHACTHMGEIKNVGIITSMAKTKSLAWHSMLFHFNPQKRKVLSTKIKIIYMQT